MSRFIECLDLLSCGIIGASDIIRVSDYGDFDYGVSDIIRILDYGDFDYVASDILRF